MEPTTQETTEKMPVADAHNDRNTVILAHAGGIFFGFIPPLIVWLMKKDDKGALFITTQAKEALNFQITVALALFVSSILIFVLIGILLIWLVWLADIVLCIMAAMKASKGENYRYPVCLRLIK
ncbi:MAG: DUF4870 domain-containing protein [Moheibacter sp.]